MKNLFAFSLALVFLWSCKPTPFTVHDLTEFAERVSGDDIKHHIAVLADDSMKGRLPGTPEYELAMQYVAEQYKAIGLKPMGDSPDSYLQNVTIRTSKVYEEQSLMLLNDSDTLQQGLDFIYMGDLNRVSSYFEGEIVFAGYGIEAPELGWNDFENIDLSGKIAMIFLGSPKDFPASERAHFSNFETKFNTISEKGAIGTLLMFSPEGRGNFSGYARRFSQRGNTGIEVKEDHFIGRRGFGKELQFGAMVNDSFVEKAVGISQDSLWTKYKEQGVILPMDISIKGSATYTHDDFQSANVIGFLEGSEMKDEYIIHTAHLDHVGIGTPVKGDSIYNGAHDNASGTSCMIEIARLYANLPYKPKRSVIFAAVTAEEMGLLGSAYLAENLPVERSKVVANVNTDMPTLIAPLLSIEPLGAQHSSIIDPVKKAADLLELDILDDHMPEQVRFVRSDQYNFILQGIPSLHIKYGLKTANSDDGLKETIENYTKMIYHKPSDELNDLFDFEAGRKFVRLNFMVSYFINTDEERPAWNEGDFFTRFANYKLN